MKTLPFAVNDPETRLDLLTRFLPEAIEILREDAVPSWGAMTPQHMVEHLAWVFDVSTGKAEGICNIPEVMREFVKPWLFDDRPSPRGIKNPMLPEVPGPLTYATMLNARAALQKSLDNFIGYRNTNSQYLGVHPILGPLRFDDWERFHFKHGYHHLLQFGLIGDANSTGRTEDQ
jgi:uncharacterized protein DUF1569